MTFKSAAYLRFERVPGSIDALDGLRAIAVLMVMLAHSVNPVRGYGGRPDWTIGDLNFLTPLLNGWIGVDLFFVLSGFLIGKHLLHAFERGDFRWGRYIGQRALRIVPAYWFVLAISVGGLIPFFELPQTILALRVLGNFLFMEDYLQAGINNTFWTLGVEEKFYLAAPLLMGAVFAVRRFGARLGLLLAVILVVLAWRILSATEPVVTFPEFLLNFRSPFHRCLDTLAVGAVAVVIYEHVKKSGIAIGRSADLLTWCGFCAVVTILCGGQMYSVITWWDMTFQATVIGLAFGAMLLGCALGGGPQRLLAAKPLLIVARISYPLYLIHFPLIPLCWVLVGMGRDEGPGRYDAFFVVFFIVSFAAALAIHFVIEKPFLILKDGLAKRARLAPEVAALAPTSR